MPLYKYRCTNKECNKVTEHLSKLGDTKKTCDCGEDAIKAFSPNKAVFQVNGAGAYNSGQMKGK